MLGAREVEVALAVDGREVGGAAFEEVGNSHRDQVFADVGGVGHGQLGQVEGHLRAHAC